MNKDHLEEVYENTDDWWKDSAERALAWLARDGQPFDAYDLTELGVPDPDHPAQWGALFRTAHQRGDIEPLGFRESRRPTRSGGILRVWRGVNKSVAPTEVEAA